MHPMFEVLCVCEVEWLTLVHVQPSMSLCLLDFILFFPPLYPRSADAFSFALERVWLVMEKVPPEVFSVNIYPHSLNIRLKPNPSLSNVPQA